MGIYKYSEHKSTLGNADANAIATITYIIPLVISFVPYIGSVAWIVPILLFLTEKNSKLVKFHSLQSISLYVLQSILVSICGIVPLLGFLVGLLIKLVFLLLTIVMVIKAYNYEQYELPYIGRFISKLI